MEAALAEQSGSGQVNLHREWITLLLEDLLRPHVPVSAQPEKKERVIFEGSTSKCRVPLLLPPGNPGLDR